MIDVLLGLQWGDEGKGKIIDVLTPQYDIIARFQGGPNAGHTLEFNGQKHVLHLIPSGIFHEGKKNLLGNGMVIDPIAFQKEVEALLPYISMEELKKRIVISNGAILILPTHRLLDAAHEAAKGKGKIGSTLKGIGPAYTDHVSRNALHIGDIQTKEFGMKHHLLVSKHHDQISFLKYDFDNKALLKEVNAFFTAIEFMKSFEIVNGPKWLNWAIKTGKKILAEGAQGSLLDVNFGTYPFVTSSNTTIGGVCTRLGIAPQHIGKVYGLFKAYCTQVGAGPFPTELGGQESDEWCASKTIEEEKKFYPDADINDPDPFMQGIALRKKGFEFGATTGRLRRTGWLDLALLNDMCEINGVTDLVMSKADVLSEFDSINVCIGYEQDGTPIYQTFEGWKDDLQCKECFLPQRLNDYMKFIEKETETKISIISTGPDRDQIIIR